MHPQVRGAELEAELDSVREEANSRNSQLEESTKEQTRTGQQQQSELQTRRKEVADLQAKLHNLVPWLTTLSGPSSCSRWACCLVCSWVDFSGLYSTACDHWVVFNLLCSL